MQPLLTGDSAVSFSHRELQDLLSCHEPTRGPLPVSELFLLATTGPGPDPRLSCWTLGPVRSGGVLCTPGPSASLPEALRLLHFPFRLSEEETWLIWPSFSSEERETPPAAFIHCPQLRGEHLDLQQRPCDLQTAGFPEPPVLNVATCHSGVVL